MPFTAIARVIEGTGLKSWGVESSCWLHYFLELCLTLLIPEMGLVIVPTPRGYHADLGGSSWHMFSPEPDTQLS